MGVDARTAISALLAAGLQPFELAQVYRASCGDLVFETTSEHVGRIGHACNLKQAFLQEVLRGKRHVGDRRVGHCELRTSPTASRSSRQHHGNAERQREHAFVELRQNIAHRHAVEVTACVPQRAVVLHAATGTGKTFVASVPALGKTTYCHRAPEQHAPMGKRSGQGRSERHMGGLRCPPDGLRGEPRERPRADADQKSRIPQSGAAEAGPSWRPDSPSSSPRSILACRPTIVSVVSTRLVTR